MDRTLIKKLLLIAAAGTGIGGLVLLCISFIGVGDWTLPAALGAIGISNLFNVFRLNAFK